MKRARPVKVKGPDNTIFFIAGRKGSGKSTLLREVAAEYSRVFVFDTLGTEGEPDYEVVSGGEACVSRIELAAEEEKFRISLRSASTEELLALVPLVETVPDCLVVFDETSYYCSPNYLPDELSSLLRYGRHQRISQIYVARRPSEIHREVTAAADIVATFQHHEPRDLNYFRDIAGEKFSDAVRRLPRFRVAVYGDLTKCPLPIIEASDFRLDSTAEPD